MMHRRMANDVGRSHDTRFPVHTSTAARSVLSKNVTYSSSTLMSDISPNFGLRVRTHARCHGPTKGVHVLWAMATPKEMEAKLALLKLEKTGSSSASVLPYMNTIALPEKKTERERGGRTRVTASSPGHHCFDTHTGPIIRLIASGGSTWLPHYLY